MKHFFIYLVLALLLFGSSKVTAQTNCPNIEWMRFFNDSANYSCNIFNIDSDKNSLVVGYYEGSPSWGSFNFPTATNLMTNYFISKADSIGSPLWLHVAKSFTYGGGSAIGRPITSFNNDIYTVVNFKWKTEFAGTTYMANAQKANSLLVKMNQQGGIIATHLFDSTSFALIHMDDSLNYYCFTGFSGTYYIDNHIFNSIGGIDYLVFKLNSQFQLQWAQQIGGAQTESIEAIIADSQNNIYIAGRFNSPTLTLGNTQLTNPYSSTSTNDIYIAKINSNGQFAWAEQTGIQSSGTFCIASGLELDSDDNLYISGSLEGGLNLNSNPVNSQPNSDYNSFLLKYTPTTQQFSSMLLKGGNNYGGSLLYLPHKNMMALSGLIANNDTVDFGTESITANNSDFYVLGIDLSTAVSEKMTPQWVVHSHGHGTEVTPLLSKDSKENIYLSGMYSDDLGAGAFGNYTFPAIPGNGSNVQNTYQAKLAFLSREVTVDSGTLTAVQDSAMYQWLDCSNGMQPIPGATGQSFSPAQPGNYAVRVSNSFCSVVSDCFNTTGISALQQLQQINIYPNPVQETLNLNHLPLGTQVAVFDVLGRKLFSGVARESNMKIAARKWAPGLYVIELNQKGTKYFKKVVKE